MARGAKQVATEQRPIDQYALTRRLPDPSMIYTEEIGGFGRKTNTSNCLSN